MKKKSQRELLLQGNEAIVEGALQVGCRFFAGYPITPATEISEVLSIKLPQVGGTFIQMEDEIASLGVVIGASLADVYRILARGGIFMYPLDGRDPGKWGRLRLMYEANPMAMLVEQAGGAASTGRGRILEVEPTSLHQRVPVILGSRDEVARIESYHHDHDAGISPPTAPPLFGERSLFTKA